MKAEWKKILKRARLIITVVIIAGVLIHLILVYDAAKSLEIEKKRIIGIYPTYRKIDEYELRFSLSIKNPESTSIEVDYINYRVYIENEFVGEGEKPHFIIKHGLSNHTFSFIFSTLNLTEPTKKLFMRGNVNVTVKGDVIVPAKFMGLFTWRHIKIPYEIHEKVKISL